jgi:cell division protein FtsN
MKDREADVPVRTAAQQPASMASSLEPSIQAAAPTTTAPEEPAASRFDFYEMLPNFEVIIPEQETNVSRDTQQEAVVLPGIYVLQAGSFTKFEDADRRRAQIALQGIESRIQRVTIDDKTYHRVRIGPTDDLDELNRLRNRLKQAKIDVLRIRVGD